MGPHFKKLVIHKMSLDAVPAGGGIGSALKFLSDPQGMAQSSRAAKEWVESAIALIRTAAEPNPWKTSTDEEIAGELLRQIEERKKSQRNAPR